MNGEEPNPHESLNQCVDFIWRGQQEVVEGFHRDKCLGVLNHLMPSLWLLREQQIEVENFTVIQL